MLNRIIHWSLRNRLLVIVGAAVLLVYGGITAARVPIDVFPDLTAPTVTVLTEAHGLAPEEVEALISVPLESALNGTSGVFRVRSNSAVGLSLVFVEFELDTDIYRARQLVTEKLQQVRLPDDVSPPVLGPISSTMGEIMLVSMRADGETSPMDLRSLADWVLRPRLLAISGVSQVTVIGGDLKQYQVLVDPARLVDYDLSLDEVTQAVEEANAVGAGGIMDRPNEEFLIRGRGRVSDVDDLAESVIGVREGRPVLVRHVAEVRLGAAVKRGDASFNMQPATVVTVQKQPNVNTLELTAEIERTLDEMQATLPSDVEIDAEAFQQARFIDLAVGNVREALLEGGVMVAVVLFLFLWNFRTTLISLTAIPLSLLTSILAMSYFGISINTMTLGGLAIAIGELVDDAIVDVENVFRRLKENAASDAPEPALKIVFQASSEIRNSIFYATLIIILVFLPLFSLAGFEGRMFAPLAFAYIVSIAASLVVALTVTPVLCYWFLGRSKLVERRGDSVLVGFSKRIYARVLAWSLDHPYEIIVVSVLLLVTSLSILPLTGREFLPPFNEGSMNINVTLPPGTSLAESNRIGTVVEEALHEIPEVVSTTRRTGRAELDEHAAGVNASELEVITNETDRTQFEVMDEVRESLSRIPGVGVEVGQPISHRIDHLLSGTRAQIAIKLFGPDLPTLRNKGEEIRAAIEDVAGIVDLLVEPQVGLPQVQVRVDRNNAAALGLSAFDVTYAVENAFNGIVVGQVLERQRSYDIIVRLEDGARQSVESIANTLIATHDGTKIPLAQVADVRIDQGPNTINRENGQRRIIVQANVSGRDLGSVIDEVRGSIGREVALPEGYFLQYGGQFEAQETAADRILWLSLLTIGGIFLLLYMALGSVRTSLLVMANLPLALIGGVAIVFLSGGTLSIASLVGFITLFGIATRNGIMLVTHYSHLIEQGVGFRDSIMQGSMERLSPILMTALVTGVGLIPLAIGVGTPGKEIQQPMAAVILGGMLTSTFLNMVVIPTLYLKFGPKPEAVNDQEWEGAGDVLPVLD